MIRPCKSYSEKEAQIIRAAHARYRFGARMLEPVIRKQYKVCVILDDASRMVLSGEEFSEINTENSKLVVDQLVDKYWWLCPMRELILDHGSEFRAHRIHDDGSWNSKFKDHLKNMASSPY